MAGARVAYGGEGKCRQRLMGRDRVDWINLAEDRGSGGFL
jgi:hypothetical protein